MKKCIKSDFIRIAIDSQCVYTREEYKGYYEYYF